MTPFPVVCNASPLIALEQIGRLNLLPDLFETVTIPPAVQRETAPTVMLPDWVRPYSLTHPIGPTILQASLGPGESEAISLALELEARLVILDDRPARRLAQSLGLPVIGTLGLLLTAKQKGWLDAIKPHLDTLLEHDFRVSPRLYDQIIADAGEM